MTAPQDREAAPREAEIRTRLDAFTELRAVSDAVRAEMAEHGARGELRQNSQMPSWHRYKAAEALAPSQAASCDDVGFLLGETARLRARLAELEVQNNLHADLFTRAAGEANYYMGTLFSIGGRIAGRPEGGAGYRTDAEDAQARRFLTHQDEPFPCVEAARARIAHIAKASSCLCDNCNQVRGVLASGEERSK